MLLQADEHKNVFGFICLGTNLLTLLSLLVGSLTMCFLKQGIVGFLEGSKGFEGCGVSSSAAVRKTLMTFFCQVKKKDQQQFSPIPFPFLVHNFHFIHWCFF
jgi:hypothetical protein